MKPLPLLVLLLLVAASAVAAERGSDGSSHSCKVLKRPAGVPGQAAITMCTNVTSLPAGKCLIDGRERLSSSSFWPAFDCFLCERIQPPLRLFSSLTPLSIQKTKLTGGGAIEVSWSGSEDPSARDVVRFGTR